MEQKNNKNSQWILTIIAVLLIVNLGAIGIYVLYPDYVKSILSREDSEHTVHTPSRPVEETEKEKKKILYWKAPMDPTYISDKPGKSPMGMDLIPVYEEKKGKEKQGTVVIDPDVIQTIGVKTVTVKQKPLQKILRTVGRITYDERKLTYIHSKIPGWIEKLYINFTGEEVKKNDILLEIYSPELVSSQEEYLLALNSRKTLQSSPFDEISQGADSLLKSARRRLELWDVAEHQILELETTQKIMKTLHIHSPTKGIVIEKTIQEGSYVKPGMNLYTLADISTVWIYADIYEYEIPWIEVGQTAEVTLSYFPGKTYKGKVTFIYPYLNSKTRTVRVRMEFPNPKLELKPEMYANVKLQSILSKQVLIIPSEAIIRSGDREIVFIVRGGGKFEAKDITTGVESEGYHEVIHGLNQGEEIVTSANFLIDSESRLKEAINKMLTAKKEGKKPIQQIPSNHDYSNTVKKMDHNSHTEKNTSTQGKGHDHEMKKMDIWKPKKGVSP